MCGPRQVVLYFLTLVRTITAIFFELEPPEQQKKYFSSYSRVEGGPVAMATKYGLEGDIREFVPYPSLIYIHSLISSGDL